MTKAEEILEKHLKINDVETMLGKHGRTHNAVINALNEAINYTRCCETLKDKEADDFDVWRLENKWQQWYDTGLFKKGNEFKRKEELRKIYKSEQSL